MASGIVPAAAGQPHDKAKVECGVLVAERRTATGLRNRRFFSLGELNEAIGILLVGLNELPFKNRQDRGPASSGARLLQGM